MKFELEVVKFDVNDIVTASGNNTCLNDMGVCDLLD